MSEMLEAYQGLICSLGLLAALMVVQMLVVDFTAIRRKHVPGMPVTEGHDSFLFRAARAHGNSNESLPTFILITVFAVAVQASPGWLNTLVAIFVAARAGHMVFYYMNYSVLRSVSFGIGLLAMIGMLVVGLLAIA